MPSPFDDLAADLSAAVNEAFGETVAAMLRPRVLSQYSGRTADPSRAARQIFGIFSAGAAEEKMAGASRGEFAGSTRMATRACEFWLSAAAVAGIPYRIATGDLIEFPGRAGEPAYSVASIHASDLGDINLILTVEDQAPQEA